VGHKVVGRSHDGAAVGNHDNFRAGEPGCSKDGGFVAGRGVPDALSSSTVFTEIATAKLVDIGHGRRRKVGIETVAVVDVHDDADRFEHLPHGPGDERPVEPVKRRREGHHSEFAQGGRKVLGPAVDPAGVRDATFRCEPLRLCDHSCVGVEADDLFEETAERKRHRPWPAADVEQSASTVESEGLLECLGQSRGVGEATFVVVRGGPSEEGFVPFPFEPLAGHDVDCSDGASSRRERRPSPILVDAAPSAAIAVFASLDRSC
jgi:hypothetical protein